MFIARLSHISVIFPGATKAALDDISLDFVAGERVCILGANGSGKSSLAATLAALMLPNEGDVELFGHTICKDGLAQTREHRTIKGKVGYVFQSVQDQFVTTVAEDDIAFGPENLAVAPEEIHARVHDAARATKLPFALSRDPRTLSGGQAQRLAMAGALAMESKLLILDEPSAQLDPLGRKNTQDLMEQLEAQNYTIIHITHHMNEALLADRAIVLSHGRVAFDGSPKELFQDSERLLALHLELPFVPKLARALDMSATYEEELVDALSQKLSGKTLVSPGRKGAFSCRSILHIAADNVSFSYQDAHSLALDSVSFSVCKGESVAIVGHAGSGKSSLAKLMCGLTRPSSGSLTVLGRTSANKKSWQSLLGRVGYLMQNPEQQLFAQTVLDDVRFAPLNQKLGFARATELAESALELVGLKHLAEKSPFELSGGEQRLVALAGVLAMQPEIIILDEPTSGLDPRASERLLAVLRDLHEEGITLIHITHHMRLAARADSVYVLDNGKLLLNGSAQEVFSAKNLELLERIGLGLPHAAHFALRLKEAHISWSDSVLPLTTDELASALLLELAGDAYVS